MMDFNDGHPGDQFDAIREAKLRDVLDTVEMHEQFKRRMEARDASYRLRVERMAALMLCAERGHDRKLRGCQMCRDDVAAVAW